MLVRPSLVACLLLGLTGTTVGSVACQRGAELASPPPATQADERGAEVVPAEVTPQSAEEVWLSHIGTGPSQTARVCSRGGADRVATALCNGSAPPIAGLEDLYRALKLGSPDQRLVAATTHSLALPARIVSAVNPRAFVFENASTMTSPIEYERLIAVAFTRGEQFVELVGLDPKSYEYTFYLMHFEQECNRSRCTPEDLLTEKIESGWTSWTLYADVDLEDTPLDCVSCHLPFGAGTHKLLLMRQVFDPWMHWGDFRGGDEGFLCPVVPEDGHGEVVVTSDGLDPLVKLEGQEGRYAGVPVQELNASESGKVFVSFIADAEQAIRTSPYPNDYPYEQLAFQTREVLCERFHTGKSPTWERHRRESLARGLPVPYYGPDVLDPDRRAEVLADRGAYLRRHEDEAAFDVASGLLGADVATAVGFSPRSEETAPEMLTAMCIRCHASTTDQRLRRSGFNAESIDRVEPALFHKVMRRLRLPKTSPELMPPVRTGELPDWAITRIETYLRDRCTEPGACG